MQGCAGDVEGLSRGSVGSCRVSTQRVVHKVRGMGGVKVRWEGGARAWGGGGWGGDAEQEAK